MNMKIKMLLENDIYINSIKNLTDAKVYLVGGAVRDFIMGKTSFDRDLIVDGESAYSFAYKIAESLNGTFITLDSENNIYRVVLEDKVNYFDITNPIQNDLKLDIMRRDLTINAIAVDISSSEIIDYCGSLDDINNKIIRAISENNMVEDPLRILRAFRFQATTGFEIENNTLSYIKRNFQLILEPAKERVNYELMKLFDGEYFISALKNMNRCGVLELLFPFVKELKQVPPNSHHHLDLFNHSLETANQVQLLYVKSGSLIREHLDSVDFGGFSRLAHLKMSAFMHDIGKFSTWTIEEDTGRHRFIKHDDVGSKLAISYLKDLKFSNKQIAYITSMIKYHIYPASVMQAPEITDKIMMRFVRKMENNSIDNIILAMADRLSARGVEITEEIIDNNIRSLNSLLEFYLSVKDTLKPLPVLLNGNDVMQILDLKPSPKLGEIMNLLHEAQLNGEVLTKEQAITFVKAISL